MGVCRPGRRQEWFAPLQPRLTELSDDALRAFRIGFADLAVLMAGAPDACVDVLTAALRRKPDDTLREEILAAIGSERGLHALADRRAAQREAELAVLGIAVPPGGPARWRFSPERLAVFVHRGEANVETAHPIGVALEECVDDATLSSVSWHYLSVASDALSPIVRWPAPKLHLVSPRVNLGWTLFAAIDAHGRYRVESVTTDEDDYGLGDLLAKAEQRGGERGWAELRPYDEHLVYCNGHIMLTDGVVGTVGGPPIGLYPNPNCRGCGQLMFHVLSVEHGIREYGDGFPLLVRLRVVRKGRL